MKIIIVVFRKMKYLSFFIHDIIFVQFINDEEIMRCVYMNKKVILSIIAILIFIISCFLVFKQNNSDKLFLSEKFYNGGKFIKVKSADLSAYSKDTYLLFTYNDFCTLKIPCDKVFEEFMQEYKIDMLSIPIDEFKQTLFYKTVLYAPSVLIIKNNKIIAYLDANKDDDVIKYQDSQEFAKWLNNYISLNK